jgi:hypothetical protein
MITTTQTKNVRVYKVIILDKSGEMIFTYAFLTQEDALQIFNSALVKASDCYKISIEAILV